MPRDSGNIVDGWSSLPGGMHSGLSPSVIPSTQVSYSVNTTFRKGFARTRPKLMQLQIDFGGDTDGEDWFNQHPITGGTYYIQGNGEQTLVCASGGRFYQIRINGSIATGTEITPTAGRMSMVTNQTWFKQASQFLVAQDNVSTPLIFDGSIARYANYSDPDNPEVPTGNAMEYINDRLFVVLPDGVQIAPGDLVSVTPTSVITFSEVLMPAADGGQYLTIPVRGPITGLIATAQTNTLAGQGVLLAYTSDAVCSINPIVQRNLWPTIQLQNVAMIGNGFLTPWCTSVNSDIWGRSVDGWRSYIMASQEFGQWGNTPQSYEIQRILDKDSVNLLGHASFIYFDNRLLGTVSPVSLGAGVYHRGIAVIDFVNSASLTAKAAPDYDGLWTGIQPYCLVKGTFAGAERAFAFCYESPTSNTLWEITKEYGDDNDETRIPCMFETRAFNFRDVQQAQNSLYYQLANMPQQKKLDDLEIWVDQMRGQVDFDVKYRPDQYPCWFDWKSWTRCAKDNNCDEEPLGAMECQTPVTFEDQYRPRMALGQPPDLDEAILAKIARFGYEFQIRMQWTGQCRIRLGRLYAHNADEKPWPLDYDAGQ